MVNQYIGKNVVIIFVLLVGGRELDPSVETDLEVPSNFCGLDEIQA
ncbi:hypothetical protein RintRC_7618 [Richelia intracellularis]|nr:hypothetical protein RintRC_7618 [Richelia intracellularis]